MGRLRRMKDPLLSEGNDKMLRVTANTQLMREIIDLLSVLAEEAKLVWGEKGRIPLWLTDLTWHCSPLPLVMSASRPMR